LNIILKGRVSMRKLFFSKTAVCISLILIIISMQVNAGPRDHNGGFFLRLSAGAGGAETTWGDNLMKFSGVSSSTNFAIGGVILPNMALHATLFGWLLSEPDMEILGIPATTNESVLLSGIGIGVTYYIMPVNIYLSPSIGLGTLSEESGGSTDIGFMLDMSLGKEWWVGGSWGLGVAGGFGYHSVPEKDVDVNWSGYDLSIRFTATLN
jgi:hypothetical protein